MKENQKEKKFKKMKQISKSFSTSRFLRMQVDGEENRRHGRNDGNDGQNPRPAEGNDRRPDSNGTSYSGLASSRLIFNG